MKDSGLVASAAAATKVEVPLLDQAHDRFQRAARAGLGARDDSRVIETSLRPTKPPYWSGHRQAAAEWLLRLHKKAKAGPALAA